MGLLIQRMSKEFVKPGKEKIDSVSYEDIDNAWKVIPTSSFLFKHKNV